MNRIDAESETLIAFQQTGQGWWNQAEAAQAIRAEGGDIGGGSENLVAHSLRADGFDASEDGTGRGTPLVPVAFNWQGGGTQTTVGADKEKTGCLQVGQIPAIAFTCKDHGADAGETAPTLRSMGHDGSHANAGGQVAVALNFRGREGGTQAEVGDEVATALRCVGGTSSKSHAMVGMAVRRLTPRECERLQGIEDDFTAIPGAADGPRYKALGNGMARPCIAWIGRRILEIHSAGRGERV